MRDHAVEIIKCDNANVQQLYNIANGMRSEKEIGYFEKSMDLQSKGERDVLMMLDKGREVGYCMLSWQPKYGFYRKLGIPEIQDLNILPRFRRQGLGRRLIEHCEELARRKKYEYMGIGVGLDASYGAAQRLYVKMGYIPDGNGVTYDRVNVVFGEMRPVDNDLSLMMVKSL